MASSACSDLCVPCASVRGSSEAAWDGEVFSHGGAEITEDGNDGNPTPCASGRLGVIPSSRTPAWPTAGGVGSWRPGGLSSAGPARTSSRRHGGQRLQPELLGPAIRDVEVGVVRRGALGQAGLRPVGGLGHGAGVAFGVAEALCKRGGPCWLAHAGTRFQSPTPGHWLARFGRRAASRTRKRRSWTACLRRWERVTASHPTVWSRACRFQPAAYQTRTAASLPSSNTNWHRRSPASEPAPRPCSRPRASLANRQSAAECATRTSILRDGCAGARGCPSAKAFTSLGHHFLGPMFSRFHEPFPRSLSIHRPNALPRRRLRQRRA